MGFPIKQHIIGAIILLSVVTGCIQGVTDKEEAPVSTIQTEISCTEVVESQQPAVSHTPIPTVIADLRQDVSEVEEALVSEYGYDRGEIDQERLMVLEVMQRMRGEGEKLEKMIMQVIHYEGKEFEICFTSECL